MIIELDDVLISEEIFSALFACDLQACKGACCVEGDRGAPLEMEELGPITENLEIIRDYMTKEGKLLLGAEGFHEGSETEDPATTCLPGGECVFAVRENGILGCAIEKAYNDGKSSVNKPISCHLYPIRVGKAGELDTLNYHRWSICAPACVNGKKMDLPLFRFLKSALVRKYGQAWYNELETVYEEYLKHRNDMNL